MSDIQIGLVGCGLFGESHLRAYRAVRGARIAAVYDIDRGRAERIASEFAIPRVCGGVEELCALPEIQAIDVVTPEHLHREPVLAALAHGKHVFVEKPLATDLDDCDRMIRAATAADCSLMVGHLLRFETKYAMLKEALAARRLGAPVSIHARRNRPKAHLPLYGRVHLVLETGIHDIDIMLWYVGKPVRRVRGYSRSTTGGELSETFWGVIEFEGGAIGILETIWLLPEGAGIVLDDAIQVIGDAGVGNIQLAPGTLSFWRDDGFEVPDVSYDPRVMDSARGALRDELDYFCECVQAGRKPALNTGIEAKRAVRVALALIASAESGADVAIDEWD